MAKDSDDEDGDALPAVIFKQRVKGSEVGPGASKNPYIPKHTFERLVSEGTASSSILGDEEFWSVAMKTTSVEPVTGGKIQQTSDTNDNPSAADDGAEEEAKILLQKNHGIPYTTAAPSGQQAVEWQKIFLNMDDRNVEELLIDDVIEDVSPLELTWEQLPMVFNKCPPQLVAPIIKLIHHKIVNEGDELMKRWNSLSKSMQLSGTCAESRNSMIQLYCFLINQYPSLADRTVIKESFVELVHLALDNSIFEGSWRYLRDLAMTIVNWLDVPRIHLLLDWIGSCSSEWSAHPHRVIDLIKLFDASTVLGQLAAKLLLDRALFPSISDDYSEGNDDKFFKALSNEFAENTIYSGAELYTIACLACARLHCTTLTGAFGEQCEELLRAISKTKTSLPPSHITLLNIRSRELLAKMETYLRSFLCKRGILRR